MLRKIDKFTVSLTQKLVNVTGKPVAWCATQLAYLLAVISIVDFLIRGSAFSLFLDGWMVWMICRDAKREDFRNFYYQSLLGAAVRVSLLVVCATLVAHKAYMVGLDAQVAGFLVLTLAMHVLACQDPPPPRKVTKLAMGGT